MQVFLLFNKGIFFCILLKVKTQQLFISYPNIKTLFKQPNILIGLSCGQCFTANITVSQKLLCWLRTTLRRRVEYVVKQLWPRHTCAAAATKVSCFRVLAQGQSRADRCLFSSFQDVFVLNEVFNPLFCQRLLWLLLATQDMGASQSSVCQVSIKNTNC